MGFGEIDQSQKAFEITLEDGHRGVVIFNGHDKYQLIALSDCEGHDDSWLRAALTVRLDPYAER